MDLLKIIATAGVLLLLGVIVAVKLYSRKQTNQPQQPPTYTKEELDNIKLVHELYNRHERPTAVETASNEQKVAQQVEGKRKVVNAYDSLVKEIDNYDAKRPPSDSSIVEPPTTVKQTKPEFPINKPNKKAKYYPKKPKTQA